VSVDFFLESSPPNIGQALANLGLKIEPTALSEMRSMLERIQAKMREPGAPISYPVNWDSEKQRRAFFATNGFGRGIPTKRTNTYIDAWKITQVSNGLSLSNASKGAPYISGGGEGYMQSNIHKSRWNVLTEVSDAEMANLNREVEEGFSDLIRQEGF
jgi:hypothetical protein